MTLSVFNSGFAPPPDPTAATTAPQLQSNLLVPNYTPPVAAAPKVDNSPSIFGWHPEMPNLGGFKALGQLTQGILSIPEIAMHPDEWGKAAGGIVSGVVGAGLSAVGVPQIVNPIEDAMQKALGSKPQDFWQMAKHNGALYGAINTVLNALPVTGTVAGALGGAADVAEAAATGAEAGVEGGSAAAAAARAAAAEGAGMGGADASGFADDAAKAAENKAQIIQDKGLFPHPIQGLGAGGVLGSGDLAVQAGEDAADYSQRVRDMADSLRTKANIAQAIAHPFGALFHAIPEVARASFENVNKDALARAAETPEAAPTALDLVNAQTPDRSGEALTPADVEQMRSASRALQDPQEAAAEVLDGGVRNRIPHTLDEPNITPDAKAEVNAEINAKVDEAKASVDVQGTGDGTRVAAIEKKIMEPAAPWAQRLAEQLPDSVNQVLAQWSGSIDKFRIHSVARALSSWTEVTQRMIQQSDAVQRSVDAGQVLLNNVTDGGLKLTKHQASRAVGEELSARMRGTDWVSEMLRTDGDPSLVDSMKLAARGGYKGITKEMWAQLDPLTTQLLEKHLEDAEDAWRSAMQQRMQTLLASRPGAKGLESAILGLDQPMMSSQDLSDYRKARQYLRMQKYLEARAETVRDPRLMDLRAKVFDENKAAEQADILRNKEGVTQRAAEDLRTAPARILEKDKLASAAADLLDALDDPNRGGETFDPGTGEHGVGADTVVVVGVSSQGSFTVADVKANAEDIIRNAVEHPVKPDGTPYPPGIWGSKVKLGFWIGGDGKVAVDISLTHNLDGTPLSVLQGDIIGTGFKQEATYVPGEGDRALPQDTSTQNLAMHYVEDTMNQKSEFAKTLDELTQTVAGSNQINTGDAFLAVQAYARWDMALAQADPEHWAVGDYFKVAKIDYGQLSRGNVGYVLDEAQRLGQTVLHMLPGTEAAAIDGMDAGKLATALQWYYDSHDYIEGKYRYNADGSEKMITLLDGTQRNAAEVFYDLLAVTSVQASPTQNFGRALIGLANMDDFVSSRGDAALVAQDLMDKLEGMQNSLTEIVHPGQADEHVALPGERGTKLSDRFLTPEVRAMTDQTQMMNKPKYTVFDVLSGKLKLDSATAGDLQHNAEWWGSSKGASAESMDRMAVVRELDRQGATGDVIDAYKAYVVERQRVNDIFRQVEDINKKGVEGRMTPGQSWAAHPEWKAEWKSYNAFKAYRKTVLADEETFHEDPRIAAAHDQALMEHQGSSLLAKLRSFRSNLSAPDTSLAVTLDSVMGRLWGFNSQQWDKVAFYAQYADQIRSIAQELSAKWGYTVMPHQVQAALWVYAKSEIGRQDWGRLLAHHDMAMDRIDSWERGGPIRLQDRDLMGDYRNEEIGFSNQALKVRGERTFLGKEESTGYLTPEQQADAATMKAEWAEYRQLNTRVAHGDLTPQDPEWDHYEQLRETVGEGKTSHVWTMAPREDVTTPGTSPYEEEIRYEIPYDANKLKAQLTRFHGGVDETTGERTGGWDAVNAQVQEAIDNQDWARARKLVTEWTVSQKQSILGSADGASFGVTAEGQLIKGELGIADENSTFLATNRLDGARTVPKPNDMSTSRFRMEALQQLLDKGTITQEQFDAEAEKWRLSLDNGEPYLGQRAPMEPGFRPVYRGSDYPEPQGQAGIWWTDHEPYGRGGYPHWQTTSLPSSEVDRLKGQVLQDRDRLDPAGSPVVGRDLVLDPNNPLHQNAMDAAVSYMHNTIDHGDIESLHQRFFEELRGSLLDHPTKDGQLVMRMFKGAALDTLLHEGAHLLRRILTPDMLREVADAYPHILDEDVSAGFGQVEDNPLRVAAEEHFVADLMSWMRAQVYYKVDEATGEMPAAAKGILGNLFARNADVESAFGQIAAVLEDNVGNRVGGPLGSHAFDINAFWTRLFYPEINKPDVLFDPIAAGIPQMRGVETMKFPYESQPQFERRARLYGEARAQYQNASRLADQAERRAVQAETAAKKLYVMISTTPSELEKQAALYGDKADAILTKLAAKLDNPDINKVPMQWRPLWAAITDMKEMAAADKTGRLAEIMADVPKTFQAMLSEAAKRGFDPQFLPDMTWEMAEKNLFGHITLGVDRVAIDSTRKLNQNVLNRAGLANQSIESLGAGLVAATKELYSNTLIDHIEQFYTRPLAPGAAIPDGWVPWDAERSYIVTGTRASGEIGQTGAASLIVPQHVADALDSMSKNYDHWSFHTLTRANSVWRTWQLTLSPRYYIHIFVANMIRAVSYGVGPQDFIKTLRSWKEGTLPEELTGLDMVTAYHTVTGENKPDRTMASVFGVPDREEAMAEEDTTLGKVKAAVTSTKTSLNSAHATLDKFSRALVFEKDLRDGFSRDVALGHSLDVMGDYGDLSPIERSIVRSIMPFYPYYKGLLKLLARFPADHPGATMILMQAGLIHQEYMEDLLNGRVPSSFATDFNIVGGLRNWSILDPFQAAVTAVEPRTLSSSISPFVNILLSTAYNAQTKGATETGIGPTGVKGPQYDPLRGLLQLGMQVPPIAAAQGILGQATGGTGTSASLSSAVGKYLGVPAAVNAAATQQKENPTPAQKATKKAAGLAKSKATRAKKVAGIRKLRVPKPRKARVAGLRKPRIGEHVGKMRKSSGVRAPKAQRIASFKAHRASLGVHHAAASHAAAPQRGSGASRASVRSRGKVVPHSRSGLTSKHQPATLTPVRVPGVRAAAPAKRRGSKSERIAAFRVRQQANGKRTKKVTGVGNGVG